MAENHPHVQPSALPPHRLVSLASLASLVLLAPLWLFPVGALPWLGVALVLGIAAWRLWLVRRLRLPPEDIPLVFLGFMAVLGLAISLAPSLSLPRWWALLYGLVVYATLRSNLDVTRHARWAAALLALGGLGLAGISLLGTDWSNLRFVALPGLYDRLPSLIRGLPGSGIAQAGDLFNPRWVGMTMATLAPACLTLVGWRRLGWLRLLAGLAFMVLTVTLLLTQSVQGLLGWGVGVFIVLVFASRWFWLFVPLGGLAAAVVAVRLDWAQVGQALLSLDHPAGIAVVLRLDIWRQAWAMLGDVPFTGIGLNTFPVVLDEFYPGYLIGPEPHAHNLLLQTALDLGLPGLVAFVWFLVAWAWHGMATLRRLAQPRMQVGGRQAPQATSVSAASTASHAAHDPGGTPQANPVSASVARNQSAHDPGGTPQALSVSASTASRGECTSLSPIPGTFASQNLGEFRNREMGNERLLLVGGLAGVAAYLSAGLIDAMMLGAKPGFVVWALLGIGAAVARQAAPPPSSPERDTGGALPPSPPGRGVGGEAALPPVKRAWVSWLAWLVLPLLTGAAVLLFPGKASLNLGVLQAMHALHPFPAAPAAARLDPAPGAAEAPEPPHDSAPAGLSEPAQAAYANLERALVHDPAAGQVHLLLARLASSAGDFASSQAHYAARVALDLRQPVLRYHLALALGKWWGLAQPSEPAHALLKIYQAWNTRFPDRAETYLLKSILLGAYLSNPAAAQSTLEAGIQVQALPVGLLASALK